MPLSGRDAFKILLMGSFAGACFGYLIATTIKSPEDYNKFVLLAAKKILSYKPLDEMTLSELEDLEKSYRDTDQEERAAIVRDCIKRKQKETT